VDCNIENGIIVNNLYLRSMRKNAPIKLKRSERQELESRLRRRVLLAADAKIARLLLLLSEGLTYAEIKVRLDCGGDFISRWKKRFAQEGLSGLYARYTGRKVEVLTPEVEARILSWSRKKPTDGSTHWSTRRLAKKLGMHHMMIARTWQKHGIKPHRIERYMASNDPDFEKKAADIIGLYLNPPQHAAVFCVDEKTAIQALDRKDPVLPLSPGRAERHGFEYFRHGTLSLYAAFNVRNGEVIGKTTSRHTSQEFVAFLEDVLISQPNKKPIHIILDNLSAHKTKVVQELLERHPRIKLHFTPTYSSWLNQVEIWFSKIERDLIYRGVFTSVPDLARKIKRYIMKYNMNAKKIKWKYNNPKHRIITPVSNVTVH